MSMFLLPGGPWEVSLMEYIPASASLEGLARIRWDEAFKEDVDAWAKKNLLVSFGREK